METYVLMNAALGIYGGGNPAQIAADRMNKIRNGEFVTSQHRQRSGKFTKISVLPLKDGGFVETQIDVTGERTRTLQLESIVENFPGGLSMFDQDLKLILHNDKFRELLDYPQELLGKENVTFRDMLRFNAKRGEFGDGNIEQIVADKLDETISSEPQLIERTRPNGTALEIRIAPLEDGGFLATYVDVTERVEQQAQAIKMANYSPIAGLPNRALFLDRLEIALAQAERGACMAVQHIDIHQFGQLNTALGQKTGDRILKVLGERFLDMKRDTDTFAHLGADEFAVVQVGIEGMEGAEILARRILRTIREPIEIDGQIHELDACIGIALAPENGTFSDEIQSKVDTALHNAKIVGPGMIMFFHNCANRISL